MSGRVLKYSLITRPSIVCDYVFCISLKQLYLYFKAAQDACDLMGHRKFYDQVLEDIIHYDTYKITDQIDVTTLKDYMQVNLKNIPILRHEF